MEIFNTQGVKQRELLNYTQVCLGDGIIIDSNHYTILADCKSFNVFVFTDSKLKLYVHKTINGFSDQSDIGMGFKCGYLLVADYNFTWRYLPTMSYSSMHASSSTQCEHVIISGTTFTNKGYTVNFMNTGI